MALTSKLKKAGMLSILAFCVLQPSLAGGQNAQAPAASPENNVELTLPQARKVAVSALRSGQPELAYRLAKGLLEADPRSSFAHFTLANAQGLLGQPTAARKSAARAFRYADNKLHRFEAAELAARLSFAGERPTLTQLWLRRAVQNAPNAQVEAQLARDYAQVRAQNPFSFSIRGGLRPSSNVNGGANTAVQIIEGSPLTGRLSGSAQALSGLIGNLDTTLRYRLRADKRSRTELSGRLYLRRVALSESAKAQAPDVSNGDFGSTFAELNLSHSFAVGTDGDAAHLGASLGQFWSADRKNYHFAKLSAGYRWRLGARNTLSLDGALEQRMSDRSAQMDSTVYSLAAGLRHNRANGDRLSFALNLREVRSDFVNSRTHSTTLSAQYAFGKQMGPAKISAGLALGYSDFPDYVTLIPVPGGRQDKSLYAHVDFFFPDVDYAGFAPTLRVTAGRKFSNVSRFETEELSVSLGIQSKF